MTRLRTVLFWSHLAAGVAAGVVIAIMAFTGAMLALQPQILAWLERDVRVVPAATDRRDLDDVVRTAMAVRPGAQPISAAVESDPRSAVSIGFGRDGTVWVDPHSGRVLGEGATTARAFFQSVTEWHRWLARSGDSRQTARSITGAGNVAFLLLGLSGLYLWMPRRWSIRTLRAIAWFQRAGTPRARDFNWHNAIGFWCAPAIIVMTGTGVVMSYPWANRLVYQLAGTPLPVQQVRSAGNPAATENRQSSRGPVAPDHLDRALAIAGAQLPTWRSMTIRFASRSNGPLSLTLVDGAHWNPFARSTLIVDGDTGAAVRWEPYVAQTRGQKWRGWIRFAHTGELGGVTSQAVAGIACVGGVVLVWTGLSLAIRRLAWSRLWKQSVVQSPAGLITR